MEGYIGLTDINWFENHKSQKRNQVVFWRRRIVPVKLAKGDYFFFFVKGIRLVKGYGIVSEIGTQTLEFLFKQFGNETGWISIDNAINITGKSKDEKIGFYILKDIQYFEDGIDLKDLEIDFKPNTVSGKRIDKTNVQKILEKLENK